MRSTCNTSVVDLINVHTHNSDATLELTALYMTNHSAYLIVNGVKLCEQNAINDPWVGVV